MRVPGCCLAAGASAGTRQGRGSRNTEGTCGPPRRLCACAAPSTRDGCQLKHLPPLTVTRFLMGATHRMTAKRIRWRVLPQCCTSKQQGTPLPLPVAAAAASCCPLCSGVRGVLELGAGLGIGAQRIVARQQLALHGGRKQRPNETAVRRLCGGARAAHLIRHPAAAPKHACGRGSSMRQQRRGQQEGQQGMAPGIANGHQAGGRTCA